MKFESPIAPTLEKFFPSETRPNFLNSGFNNLANQFGINNNTLQNHWKATNWKNSGTPWVEQPIKFPVQQVGGTPIATSPAGPQIINGMWSASREWFQSRGIPINRDGWGRDTETGRYIRAIQ
jgi:hypothetical protein